MTLQPEVAKTDFTSSQLQNLLADMNVDGEVLATRLLVPTSPSNAVESWKRHCLWFHPCRAKKTCIKLTSCATCWLSGRQLCNDQQSKSTSIYLNPQLSKSWIKYDKAQNLKPGLKDA